MNRRKIRSFTLVWLILSLLTGLLITPISAGEVGSEIRPMTAMTPMQILGAESNVAADGNVTLIDGTASAWIDRVKLPTAIREFYDLLVEGVDNDGVADILIEDEYYYDSNYVIEVVEETIPLNGRTAEAVAIEMEERYMPYLYVVFGALDRDHPEVFWLSNAWQTGSSYSYDKTSCTVTILVSIRQIRASAYPTEAAIRSAISRRDAAVAEICKDFTWETTPYERIVHFNDVLTKTNQYNTSKNLNAIAHDCRECISALEGQIGSSGPVCEGYARAFKVLCDANDIPCVLVDGIGKATPSASEGHMWNNVQVGGSWYGVDVTWNDPVSSSATGADSGFESHQWLLVGSDTVVNGRPFTESHVTRNQVYADFMGFPNEPTPSKTAYDAALTVALNLPVGGYVYDGAEKCPQAVVKFNGAVLKVDADYTLTYFNNRSAGTATVRVTGKGAYHGEVGTTFVIEKKALTPVISAQDKVYDGTDAAELRVTLPTTEIVEGDHPTVQGSGSFVSPNAGDGIEVRPSLTLTGTGSENYRLVLPDSLTADIEKRPVTVYAQKTVVETGDAINLTYTVDPKTPLVEGETLFGLLNFDPNGKQNVYTIIRGSLTDEANPNYRINFVSATLTIGTVEEEPSADDPSIDPSNPDEIAHSALPKSLLALLGSVGALGGGVVIAMAAGAILLIAVIALIVILVRKRR